MSIFGDVESAPKYLQVIELLFAIFSEMYYLLFDRLVLDHLFQAL